MGAGCHAIRCRVIIRRNPLCRTARHLRPLAEELSNRREIAQTRTPLGPLLLGEFHAMCLQRTYLPLCTGRGKRLLTFLLLGRRTAIPLVREHRRRRSALAAD